MPSLSIITSLQDDLLLPWLDLYESAFPLAERVPVSVLLRFLKERAAHTHVLAALDEEDAFAGLAFYTLPLESAGRAAFLWYLATLPQLRGQGLGAWIYRGILARLPRAVKALFFDVEIPEQAATPEERQLARRRIRFYQRLGARLLNGIRYTMQAAPDRPQLDLRLMVHPRAEFSPRAAVELVLSFAPDAIELTGEPEFE
jgi:GNAT superfamily N-acetyltransferase